MKSEEKNVDCGCDKKMDARHKPQEQRKEEKREKTVSENNIRPRHRVAMKRENGFSGCGRNS